MPKRVTKPKLNRRDPYLSKSYRELVAAIRAAQFGELMAEAVYFSTNRIGFMRRFMNLSQGKPISEPKHGSTVFQKARFPGVPTALPVIPPYDPHKKYTIPEGMRLVPTDMFKSFKVKS